MSGLPHGPSEGAAPTASMIVAATPSEPLLGRRMWLVTFTDLVSLLLAFFILLYAMSWIDEDRWRTTVDSLTRTLDPHRANEQVPTAERAVERDAAMPGDLDYLSAILARNLAQEPALAAARLTRRPGAVVLSLPGDAADAATLTALGGLLRNVDNPVSVVGHAPDATGTAWGAWHRALALAEATADALRRGGYDRPMAIRGRVHEGAVGRVEIALRDMQRDMEEAR